MLHCAIMLLKCVIVWLKRDFFWRQSTFSRHETSPTAKTNTRNVSR